jgi:hypothetical protein
MLDHFDACDRPLFVRPRIGKGGADVGRTGPTGTARPAHVGPARPVRYHAPGRPPRSRRESRASASPSARRHPHRESSPP